MKQTGASWWEKPIRAIQTNLQVKDTAQIHPERLAAQIEEMGGNVLVFNAGGIYAWYRTGVPYHTVNPYLPEAFDLMGEVISECHKRSIKFIPRFDFSKAEDTIYLSKPQWFLRNKDGEPEVIGARRPGSWSLLMSTCINSGYRCEDVAIPVLREVLTGYDVDGVFYNMPFYLTCHCDGCKRKYRETYGLELPSDAVDFNKDWPALCFHENMGRLYSEIKSINSEIPVVMYNFHGDKLVDREKVSDIFCSEPQNILSLGHRHIPEFWRPALGIKLDRVMAGNQKPIGIVHSCPGMDWRHTGIPPAEYRYWLSQVPSNGGNIWHSLTGVPDTIGDKRIIRIVSEINHQIMQVESHMESAEPVAQAVVLWNGAESVKGWADGLTGTQNPFDVLMEKQVTAAKLSAFKLVVVPDGWNFTDAFVACIGDYVKNGGNVLLEGKIPLENSELFTLLGITREVYAGEPLAASYIRFEGADNPLQHGMEETELIPHRGRVMYCTPAQGVRVLATLVPPFSPLESVGAPPERASMAVKHTDLPLALLSSPGKGKVLYMPFTLSSLINEFKLEEHYLLLSNAVKMLLGDRNLITVSHIQGLQVTVYRSESEILIHLVNGAGRRPLSNNLPIHSIEIGLRLSGGEKVKAVSQLISAKNLDFSEDMQVVKIIVPELKVWEVIAIQTV